MLRKVFCDASQSEVKKAKIHIKTRIIFLGLKAKNVTISLHVVVPILCERNTATSYSCVLFPRDGRGKEQRVVRRFSYSTDLQACAHFKIDRT